MKKIIILSITVFLSGFLSAQISITDSDMPGIGDVFYVSTPDTLFSVDVSQTGTNYSWDFGDMSAIAQRRDSFLSINDVPFAIRFQLPIGANLAQYLPTPDSLGPFALGEGYQIYQNGTTNFENLGIGGFLNGLPLAFVNNPTDKVYFFPLSYADMDSSISTAELSVPNLFFIRQERKRINEVDGWGDLTTPYGTFSSIRIRSEISGRDSIVFDTLTLGFDIPVTTEYKWLSNGMGVPVLQINTSRVDSIGGGAELVTSIRYQDSVRNFSNTGLFDSPQVQSIEVFPNPASRQVQIQLSERLSPNAEIKVFDLQGREVYQAFINESSIRILLYGFTAGTYLVQIRDNDRLYTGKLQVRAQ